MNNTPTTVRTLLFAAANLLRVKGWTQGTYIDGLGRMCVVGALGHAATGGDDETTRLRIAAQRRLASVINADPDDWRNIAAWNDASERTVGDAIGALEAAACAE